MSKAIVDGKLVQVTSINNGWVTYTDENGASRKIRSGKVDSDPATVAALEALAEAGFDPAIETLSAAGSKNHPKTSFNLDNTHLCEKCDCEFLSAESLAEHIAEEHDETPRKPSGMAAMLLNRGNAKGREVMERVAERKEAERIERVTKAPRITRANLFALKACPKCNSKELTFGKVNPDGVLEHEGTVCNCEACDWGVDFNGNYKVDPDMNRYSVGLGVTTTGRKTIDIDDYVASTLRGMDINDVYRYTAEVLRVLGIDHVGSGNKKTTCSLSDLQNRYGHLNPGMQRMNLGNVLRGVMRRYEMESLPKVEY